MDVAYADHDHDDEVAQALVHPVLPRCSEKLSTHAAMVRLSKLAETEELYMPRPDYIRDVQRDGMTEKWRHKITVWFDQLAESFKMSTETLSVAANYLDRYLSVESCGSLKFQLASVASIFLASKVEEARPFKTADFVTLSDGIFTAADLRLMELELLCTLKWHLHPPTFHTFLNLLLVLFRDGAVDVETVADRALRYAETTRVHAAFVKYPPSLVAVASIICALKELGAAPEVVAAWMHRVTACNLSYARKADAALTVTECGLKLIELDGGLVGGAPVLALAPPATPEACDAEVEHATASSVASTDGGPGGSAGSDEASRQQAGTPTDVMDIEQIEKYNDKYGMLRCRDA